MSGGVRRIGPEERTEGAATTGMVREQAIASDGMWAGYVRTAAGMVSGWHHHGAYETTIYILTGGLRMEFGAAGGSTVQAELWALPHWGALIHPAERDRLGVDRGRIVITHDNHVATYDIRAGRAPPHAC